MSIRIEVTDEGKIEVMNTYESAGQLKSRFEVFDTKTQALRRIVDVLDADINLWNLVRNVMNRVMPRGTDTL